MLRESILRLFLIEGRNGILWIFVGRRIKEHWTHSNSAVANTIYVSRRKTQKGKNK